MKCLMSTMYTMQADVLSQYDPAIDDLDPDTGGRIGNVDGQSGEFEYVQDPDSGAIIRVWKPYEEQTDPDTGEAIAPSREWSFDCIARGVIQNGIRVVGTSERFSTRGNVETVDYVTMKFPRHVLLTRRDRITNIRDKSTGRLLWVEEEMLGPDGQPRPTVFECNGVTPVIDPFGQHIENFALLARAEVQSG